jgi:ribonuclease P/MRP protein subunit RPP40
LELSSTTCKLSYSDHISGTVAKATKIAGLIRRSFQYLDETSFCTLFKALVRPILEYGNTIWAPKLKKDITTIENVQRRATKMVPGLRDLPYEERLKKLRLPSLQYRRQRGDMINTYKFCQGDFKVDTPWLLREDQTRTRGHPYKLKKKYARLEIRKNTFSHRIVDNWNSLPETVVCAPSVNAFKSRLDSFWRDRVYAAP